VVAAGSGTLAAWPGTEELDMRGRSAGAVRDVEDEALGFAGDVLKEVRKAKSEARRPMRAPGRAGGSCTTQRRVYGRSSGQGGPDPGRPRFDTLEGWRRSVLVDVELAEEAEPPGAPA